MSLPNEGSIKPLRQDRIASLGHRQLPSCWARMEGHFQVEKALRPPFGMARAGNIASDTRHEPTIGILLGAKPPDVLVAALLDAAGAGSRVYVAAGPGFGEGRQDPGLRDLKRASVLVRRLSHAPPFSALVARRGDRATIFLGYPFDQAPAFSLPLSTAQGSALFRVFLYLFWHEAQEEASTGQGPLTFGKAAERPFDVPAPGQSAPLRFLVRDEARFASLSGDTISDPRSLHAMAIPPALRVALVPPSGSGHSTLVELARKQTRIAWEDLGLPPFLVGEGEGAMELGTDALRMRLVFEPAQARALRDLAGTAVDAASHRFYHDCALEQLSGELWLPNAQGFQPITATQSLDAPSAQAEEIRKMPETLASSWPEPSSLAMQARYAWTVQPPRVPRMAREDPLITSWREMDERARTRLAEVEKSLDEAQKHAGKLERFVALARQLASFGGEQTALGKKLERLREKSPSALGPEGACSWFRDIAELEESVAVQRSDLAKKQQQAEDEEAREAKRRDFETEKKKAEQSLADAKTALAEENDKLTAALEALREIEDEKQRKEAENKVRYKPKKQIEQLEAKIRALEVDVAKEFTFERPPRTEGAKSGGKGGASVIAKLAQQTPEDTVPKVPRDALPRVGALRQHDKTRYLVIERWEDLDLGEQEANRLSARLVAPEEGV